MEKDYDKKSYGRFTCAWKLEKKVYGALLEEKMIKSKMYYTSSLRSIVSIDIQTLHSGTCTVAFETIETHNTNNATNI